jgi:very-short-patch-repair endonuclease
MNTQIDQFKDLCLNKHKMLLTVQQLFRDRLLAPTNAVTKFYDDIMEGHTIHCINIIFQHAETETEMLFLNSCLLKAALDKPLLLTFTNPIPSLDEAVKYIQDQYKFHTEAWNNIVEAFEGNPPMSYLDLIKSFSDIPEQFKDDMMQFYVLYIVFGFYKHFHISMRTPLQDITFNNQVFRPNILVWNPSNPGFKLLVEINDSEDALSSDVENNTREKILEARGFQILHFQKEDVEKNPLRQAEELIDYLFARL